MLHTIKTWTLDDNHELHLFREIELPQPPYEARATADVSSDPIWLDSFIKHQRVAFDVVGHAAISTVFIGVSDYPFESAVSDAGTWTEAGKYRTHAEAIAGHEALVSKCRAARA